MNSSQPTTRGADSSALARKSFVAIAFVSCLASGRHLFCCGFVPQSSPRGVQVGLNLQRRAFTFLKLVETESPTVLTQSDFIPRSPFGPSSAASLRNVTSPSGLDVISSVTENEGDDAISHSTEESSHEHKARASNNYDEGAQGADEEEESSADDDKAKRLANTAKAAALLARRGGGKVSSASSKKTSVGARRVGSASIARRGRTSTTLLTDAIREASTANTNTKVNPRPKKEGPETEPTARAANNWSKAPSQAARLTSSAIHATVSEMLDQACRVGSMGLFGDPAQYDHTKREPKPNTVLVKPAQPAYKQKSAIDRVSVRVASTDDDVEIASLRLSVFSDFSAEMRRSFCLRSCQVLSNRRMQGASCIVATVPRYGGSILSAQPDIILGSAEISAHEFDGTALGRRRPEDSILYVTEVAVSPTARRKGIGFKLMEGIEELASIRGAETIYLHVDVTNKPALILYERSGYNRVSAGDPMYYEFTRSLNLHDGATRGRNHFLLMKDIQHPTWLQDSEPIAEYKSTGTLGFEIPA